MPIPITVPRLGWTMDEGVFGGWHKKDGEFVKGGELLFALESEKATQDIEAIDSGVLRIPPNGVNAGDTVAVGSVLAYLLAPGELAPWESRAAEMPATAPPVVGQVEQSEPTAAPDSSHIRPAAPPGRELSIARIRATKSPVPNISPRALRLAIDLGVDWTRVRGTGRTGRIRERDIRAALENVQGPSSDAPVEPSAATDTNKEADSSGRLIPLSPVRKTIATRMRAGLAATAPVTLVSDANVTDLAAWRRSKLSVAGPDDFVPSYTDIIIKLVAEALEQHPMMMGQWSEHGIVLPESIDINVAVDTGTGLMAPLIRNVPQLSVSEIAAQMRSLVELAVAHRLPLDKTARGTFTISNLGMYGIDSFTPILNTPQSAILGIGRIRRIPDVSEDRIVFHDRMTLSLTFDHRVIDGAPAARFLETLRTLIENPGQYLESSLPSPLARDGRGVVGEG